MTCGIQSKRNLHANTIRKIFEIDLPRFVEIRKNSPGLEFGVHSRKIIPPRRSNFKLKKIGDRVCIKRINPKGNALASK